MGSLTCLTTEHRCASASQPAIRRSHPAQSGSWSVLSVPLCGWVATSDKGHVACAGLLMQAGCGWLPPEFSGQTNFSAFLSIGALSHPSIQATKADARVIAKYAKYDPNILSAAISRLPVPFFHHLLPFASLLQISCRGLPGSRDLLFVTKPPPGHTFFPPTIEPHSSRQQPPDISQAGHRSALPAQYVRRLRA